MSILRGDVLLADILYSDRLGSKRRPVLVVSTDANNAILDDLILASISSTTRSGGLSRMFWLTQARQPDKDRVVARFLCSMRKPVPAR